jgi:serine/threonine protein kinase/NTP pyrophosphatase (non-canonical NTP hydrolase)
MPIQLPPPYEFVRPLGDGTFGQVFLVRNGSSQYALKRYRHAMTSADLPEKMQREFDVTRGFRHRNLVRSHEIGTYEADGERFAFIVMEFVDGTPLNKLTLPLEPSTALDIIIDVAEGLAEASKQGVVHRDIKPGNILLDRDGKAVVVDFGMARLLDGDWAETTIQNPGSLSYCSPHSYYNASEANEGDDIFSLGCVLYYLLTGQHAFWIDPNKGSIGKLREQVDKNEYQALSQVVPTEYQALVKRMISGNKVEHTQFASWSEFMDDVVQFFPLSRRQPYALFPQGLANLRLSEFQTLIHRIYALANGERRPEDVMLRLLSSAGQLGALISKGLATHSDGVRGELTSFFCWLLALADATGIDLETAVWTKYPCACPYCSKVHDTQAAVDACKPETRVFRPSVLILTADRNKDRRPQTLLQWELLFREIFPLTFVADEAKLVQKLLEEVGEVGAGLTRPHDRLITLRRDYADPLAFELADVFAWISVCSRLLALGDHESPLASEMAKEYRSETCRRCHRAPCMCDPEQTTRGRLIETRRAPRAIAVAP